MSTLLHAPSPAASSAPRVRSGIASRPFDAAGAVSAHPAASGEPWTTTSALSHVLVVAGAFSVAVALVVLVGFNGWEYYRAPLGSRGYRPEHALLRPSGPVGLVLGISGVLAMLGTLPYALRKRWKRLAAVGTVSGWLQTHVFFGIVGPVLITFHTSFKFNGLISVAYWLMVVVWLSGFVGRYLYVRIPKTIRGAEVSRADLERRLTSFGDRLARGLPADIARAIDEHQTAVAPAGRAPGVLDLFFGELRARVRLRVMRRQLDAAGVDVDMVHEAISLASERGALARRLAHLERARHLFELWHVFHRPLVFALFAIVAVHVAVAVLFGYARLAG
jgi:hypothetical protein